MTEQDSLAPVQVVVFVHKGLVDIAERLGEHAELAVTLVTSEAALGPALQEAEVLVISNTVMSPAVGAMLRQSPRLRLVQSTASGCDSLVEARLPESVVIANSAGLNAGAVASHAIGMLLALSRNFAAAARLGSLGVWDTDEVAGGMTMLEGGLLLCLGYGAVGKTVGRVATAMGMRVIAFNRTGTGALDGETVMPVDKFDEILPEAVAVVACLPATEATRDFFNRDRFALMKPGALFVNVGRGALVDESALVDALASGRLGGAAIDVAAIEPLQDTSNLWTAQRLIITPHVAGAASAAIPKIAALTLGNIRSIRMGSPVLNLVNRSV